MTTIPVASALAALLVIAAAPPATTAQRYVLERIEGGFIRMDTASGSMARCGPQDGEWHCRALDATTSDLEAELAALKAENARLKTRLAEAEAKHRYTLDLPSDADIDRLMGVFETMMRRFMAFAHSLDRPERSDI
jgi:hypothetical protein